MKGFGLIKQENVVAQISFGAGHLVCVRLEHVHAEEVLLSEHYGYRARW